MNSLFLHPNRCYIYPMANSLRGGAIASEYNIRSLFGVLLSKSSAKTKDDFMPTEYFNSLSDNTWAIVTPKDSKNYNIQFKLQVTGGEGNCNGYYVKIDENINFDFNRNFTFDETPNSTNNHFDLFVYLRVIYSGTGVCDGVYIWVGTKSEVDSEFENIKKYGFYDIGIELGHINVYAEAYNANDPQSIRVKYIINNNIMSCIDLDRLGNANGTFADQLYNRLNRLYTLMIDIGAMTVGTVLPAEGETDEERKLNAFNPEPGTDNHDFSKISPYKIQMYINKTSEPYIGGLRYTRYDEERQCFVTLKGDNIEKYTFVDNLYVGTSFNDLEDDIKSKIIDVFENYSEYLNENKITDEFIKYLKNKTLTYVDLLTFKSNPDGSEIECININGDNCRFTPDLLEVKNLDVIGNFKLKFEENTSIKLYAEKSSDDGTLRLKVTDGEDSDEYVTFTCSNIEATNIYANGEIHGSKVYGAVWQ